MTTGYPSLSQVLHELTIDLRGEVGGGGVKRCPGRKAGRTEGREERKAKKGGCSDRGGADVRVTLWLSR